MTLRLIALGTLVSFAFCGLFVSAFHAPSPHALPVATIGAATAPPGFDLRRYESEGAAREDLESGTVRGVLLPGRLLVASARGAAEAQAVSVGFPRAAVVDVAPLPERDSRGLSVVFTALGATVGALVFGALLTLLGARRRAFAIGAFGVATGLVVALTVDPLVGALTGAFWATAAIVALAAAATAAATHALGRHLGPPGLALAALLFIPLGQSAAGGALGPDLVPGFFGAIAGALPAGATQTALRGAVYFHGAGTAGPLLVLAAWAAAGAAVRHLPRPERT
jgi:hypothetical protein